MALNSLFCADVPLSNYSLTRLSIGLRLVGFIHVFQKSDANRHHKVESVAKIIIFE